MELEHDLNSKADCEIQWEDLIFKEEMRHGKVDFWTVWLGSFARVYYGLWNGSVNPYYPEVDIAVKVYFSNQYREKVLQDYNKEASGINLRLKVLHFRNDPDSWSNLKDDFCNLL
ncbi:hypothetical protein Tco_1462766 [Tanacetum coccineum]